MSITDEFEVERKESQFLKGVDFDGEGKTLEVVKMGKFTPTDSKYGVSNSFNPDGTVKKEHWFIKNGLLKGGESFKYTFKENGVEKTFDNSSLGFYFTFVKAELEAGDKVVIKRDKQSETKVEWSIIKQ